MELRLLDHWICIPLWSREIILHEHRFELLSDPEILLLSR